MSGSFLRAARSGLFRSMPILVPRSRAERARAPSLVDVTLDPTQEAAIALPANQSLLVLGEAGHGKTTVLLHRVARVWRNASRPLRGAVLVPTEGLVHLLRPLLRRLGVDIDVWTFDRFAASQARRSFRRLPRESESTPPSVMRLKRSPALRLALETLAERKPGLVDEDREAPRVRTRAHVGRGDLQHLFGDRVLLERVAHAAGLSKRIVADVLERTRVQFSATTEREWAHVTDRRRLVAIDGRPLDEGTATEHVSTIDVEDYPVLFELDRMRAAARGETPTMPGAFDLLAVDEAQELAPLELALIGRSLAAGGTLVVSGDADQHTDSTGVFLGWENVLRELALPAGPQEGAHAVRTTLGIGYRCPPDVVAIARAVRDRTPAAFATNHGFANERELCAVLGREIEAIQGDDARASVAVICRHPLVARRIAAGLREYVPTRLVFDERFLARGPAQVSVVDEVKGLEFDYVVIPDATANEWPEDPGARRAMYVAITRARHQAIFLHVGTPTPVVARHPDAD